MIHWAWVQWLRRRMGIPCQLVDTIFYTYHGSEVVSVLHSQRSGVKLRFTCGIKQGCPWPGCIWALAYDPIVWCLLSLRP